MIEAKDFRIGNWILLNGMHRIVEAIDDTGINGTSGPNGMDYDYEFSGESPVDNATLEGIPITPEVLEKFEFEIIFSDAVDGRLKYRNRGVILSVGAGTVHFHYGNSIAILEFVHQLQNLYYDLTTEELMMYE